MSFLKINTTSLTGRYAKALFESVDINFIDQTYGEYKNICDYFTKEREIFSILKSPLLSFSNKEQILKNIKNVFYFTDIMENFVLILIQENRMAIFKDIFKIFEKLYNHSIDIGVFYISSSIELTIGQQSEIGEALKSVFGYEKIKFISKNSNDITAGFKLQNEVFLIDASLDGYLKDLEFFLRS